MNWFLIFKGLFVRGKIDEDRLNNAVTKGMITEEEKQQIIGN